MRLASKNSGVGDVGLKGFTGLEARGLEFISRFLVVQGLHLNPKP